MLMRGEDMKPSDPPNGGESGSRGEYAAERDRIVHWLRDLGYEVWSDEIRDTGDYDLPVVAYQIADFVQEDAREPELAARIRRWADSLPVPVVRHPWRLLMWEILWWLPAPRRFKVFILNRMMDENERREA